MAATHPGIREADAHSPDSASAPAQTRGGQITLRLFEERDRDGLYAVYREAFGEEALARFDRRWQWQFVDNPAAGLAPLMLWVGELEGRIVGCLSSHMTRLKIGNRELPHRFSNDLAVSTTARGWGLGTRLIGAYYASVKHLATALYFTPTNRRIHDRHGYQPVRLYPMLVRPMNVGAMARFELTSGRRPAWLSRAPMSWLVRSGAATAGLAVSIANRFIRPRRSRTYRVEQAATAGDEFDALWQSLRSHFPITTVRDRAFVQWRFFDDPAFSHAVLVARDGTGTPRGYLAISSSENRGMRVGRVVDVFCSPEEPDVLDALLREALDRFDAARVDVVSSLGMDARLRRHLQRYLYMLPPGHQSPVLVAWRERDEDRAMVFDESSYHLTGADGDQWFAP
jgi:predicted N-acetyltransferase YhbS